MNNITYKGKYLTSNIVSNCFIPNKFTFVDKSKTGNGFTYQFLKLKPKGKFKSNIIIAPNKQVLISKQENSENENIGFFYGDEKSSFFELGVYDTMMFVADSFLIYKDVLANNLNMIDRVLIDEAHSVLIQSKFRDNLKRFFEVVQDTFKDKSIVCVTATPMLFNKIDIRLIPEDLETKIIDISFNQESTFNSIKEDLANGKKVTLAIQDAKQLKAFLDENGFLNANIKVGQSMYRKIVETMPLSTQNKKYNLTIISSAGFEGFDIKNGINNVYIIEDRSVEYQSFYIQNVIQIIGRSRLGVGNIVWCRLPNSNAKELISKERMIQVANSKRISYEKKMTDKNYWFIREFFDSKADDTFGLITDLIFDETRYNLAKEFNDSDILGLNTLYKDYLAERGFKLNFLNDASRRIKSNNASNKIALKNIEINKEIVETKKLFDDIRIPQYRKETNKEYAKMMLTYFRQKYWDKPEFYLWDFNLDAKSIEDYQRKFMAYNEFRNEVQLYRFLNDEKHNKELSFKIFTIIKKKKQKELGRLSVEYKEWIQKHSESFQDVFTRLMIVFSQDKVRMAKKLRNSRDYNVLTETSLTAIENIAMLFNKNTFEVDIKNCNPRILYALAGVEFNENLYGIDKVNKIAINKLLNKISFEFRGKRNEAKYKSDLKTQLKEFGFDDVVINFLIDNFFYKSKDAIFNACAYHEQVIIEDLKSQLYKETIIDTQTCIRRHDSLITFEDLNDKQKVIINEFEYLGFKGWFKQFDMIEEERLEILFNDMIF